MPNKQIDQELMVIAQWYGQRTAQASFKRDFRRNVCLKLVAKELKRSSEGKEKIPERVRKKYENWEKGESSATDRSRRELEEAIREIVTAIEPSLKLDHEFLDSTPSELARLFSTKPAGINTDPSNGLSAARADLEVKVSPEVYARAVKKYGGVFVTYRMHSSRDAIAREGLVLEAGPQEWNGLLRATGFAIGDDRAIYRGHAVPTTKQISVSVSSGSVSEGFFIEMLMIWRVNRNETVFPALKLRQADRDVAPFAAYRMILIRTPQLDPFKGRIDDLRREIVRDFRFAKRERPAPVGFSAAAVDQSVPSFDFEAAIPKDEKLVRQLAPILLDDGGKYDKTVNPGTFSLEPDPLVDALEDFEDPTLDISAIVDRLQLETNKT
jgi:GTP cyclohydrolase I